MHLRTQLSNAESKTDETERRNREAHTQSWRLQLPPLSNYRKSAKIRPESIVNLPTCLTFTDTPLDHRGITCSFQMPGNVRQGDLPWAMTQTSTNVKGLRPHEVSSLAIMDPNKKSVAESYLENPPNIWR